MKQKIICQKCKFYFITWQQNKPHGCHAYGFKSLQMPSIVVLQSSNTPCSLYKQKIYKT